MNTTAQDFPILLAYKDELIPQITDRVVKFIRETDPLLSQGRAKELAAAVVYALYLEEYELMMKDDRTRPPDWFESLWNFMMDYSQPTIQHILVKVTATRSLLDDAIALQAGDLYMTSTFKQVTRDSAVAWTTEAIKTARAAALTTEDTDL